MSNVELNSWYKLEEIFSKSFTTYFQASQKAADLFVESRNRFNAYKNHKISQTTITQLKGVQARFSKLLNGLKRQNERRQNLIRAIDSAIKKETPLIIPGKTKCLPYIPIEPVAPKRIKRLPIFDRKSWDLHRHNPDELINGDRVFTKIEINSTSFWVRLGVKKFDYDTQEYVLEDLDDDRIEYRRSVCDCILPPSKDPFYEAGTKVMALYPDSDVLYPAIIVGRVPKLKRWMWIGVKESGNEKEEMEEKKNAKGRYVRLLEPHYLVFYHDDYLTGSYQHRTVHIPWDCLFPYDQFKYDEIGSTPRNRFPSGYVTT
ncbi:hypothetical protein PCE1_003323 [Barthelona sp. PCE]